MLRPDAPEFEQRAIGATTADESGDGEIDVVIPADAPLGRASLVFVLADGCSLPLHEIVVVPFLPSIAIDDATVVPGQTVTITARGFEPDTGVQVYLDQDPGVDDCESCVLVHGDATSDGSVLLRTQLPGDVPPGAHTLYVIGWGLDLVFLEVLSVDIAVGTGGTMPPTDTAR